MFVYSYMLVYQMVAIENGPWVKLLVSMVSLPGNKLPEGSSGSPEKWTMTVRNDSNKHCRMGGYEQRVSGISTRDVQESRLAALTQS